MSEDQLETLLRDVWNRVVSADEAMEIIDSELEVTDRGGVYALYVDCN